MEKLTQEELKWINDNRNEFIEKVTTTLLQIDTEIQIRKEELESLPTKDERIQKVSEIIKSVTDKLR
ncbi:MAG: hypothetical protein HWE07_02650 [Cytophagia bacterium]|nr:hypothetical protein [Cytophagia bacterium]